MHTHQTVDKVCHVAVVNELDVMSLSGADGSVKYGGDLYMSFAMDSLLSSSASTVSICKRHHVPHWWRSTLPHTMGTSEICK